MLSPTARRNLWLLSVSDALARFGGQFQFFAVITLIYYTTGSPFLTALQMVTVSLPIILLGHLAGKVTDRFDPRRTVAAVNLLRGALTLLYLLANSVWGYLALNLLLTGVGVFDMTARANLLPQMVGKERILQANARLATVRGAVQLLAPGLAGTLVLLTGAKAAFLFNAVSYLAPALAMRWITPVEASEGEAVPSDAGNEAQGGGRGTEPKGDVAWTFLKSRPDLLVLLLAFGAYEIGMWAVNALFVPYTSEIIHGGADVMGWSVSFYFGAGALTGVLLERYGHRLRNPRVLYGSYFVGALVWVGYTMTTSIPVALLLSAFDGLVFTYAWALFESRIQEEAPPDARGRVFGLARTGDELCSITGQLGGGAVAGWGGVLASMTGFAGLTVVLLALIGLGSRLMAARRRAVQRA